MRCGTLTNVATYCNLEVHHLVSIGGHLIAEAESVFSNSLRREDKISLPLLLSIHDLLVIRTYDVIVDIERTARLYLYKPG